MLEVFNTKLIHQQSFASCIYVTMPPGTYGGYFLRDYFSLYYLSGICTQLPRFQIDTNHELLNIDCKQ